MESWGKVRFVSAEQVHPDGRADLILTLTDSQNSSLYSFPQPKLTEAWDFDAVQAVSFKDLDQDGKKDVIVLADYTTGIGAEGHIPFTAPMIFIQKNREFVSDYDLDNSLYATGKIRTISDVTAFFKKRGEPDQPPTPSEGAATEEEVNLQLCKKAQAPDMSEEEIVQAYYDEYEKREFNLSEAGQDQMFAVIGDCFQQQTDRLLAHHRELKTKADAIAEIVTDSILHLSEMDSIRNGGGTMWGHNGNREIGFYPYYLNRYVKMKLKGASAAAREYDKLAKTLDSRLEALKKQGVEGLEAFMDAEDVKETKKQYAEELSGLESDIRNFKKFTADKDDASLMLLHHLAERVGVSSDDPANG